MKILTEYYKHKKDFKIVHREGNWAIAKGISRNTGREDWEVIQINSHNGLTMGDGAIVPPAEFPPADKQWGIKGFTAFNEQDAKRIFNNKKQ